MLTTENRSSVLYNLFLLDISICNNLVIKNNPVKKAKSFFVFTEGVSPHHDQVWWSSIHVVLTLINVVKLDVENNNIVSTLSNVININAEKDNADLTLFNVENFNEDIHNVFSTLIWQFPTSRRHITLATTLRQRWKVSWVFKNVAKRLNNFAKFIKLNTYIFSLAEHLLIAAFVSFRKGINRTIST